MNFFSRTKKTIAVVIVFLLSQTTFAATGHFYFGPTIEASFAKLNKANPSITYYDNSLTDQYPLNDQNNTQGGIGLNGGYEFKGEGQRPAIALGLGLYAANSYNFKGQVNESAGGDPAFLLYNYRYRVTSTRLMAEAQFTWQIKQFTPFFNIGLGSAWNKFSDYSESPATADTFVVYPPFHSRLNTHFAYQFGLGVGYLFSENKISLGYRYANMGNVSSDTRNNNYPFKLNAGTLSSNSIYLSYTRLF